MSGAKTTVVVAFTCPEQFTVTLNQGESGSCPCGVSAEWCADGQVALTQGEHSAYVTAEAVFTVNNPPLDPPGRVLKVNR